MDVLTIDSLEFSQLKRAFMGGHTHANHCYVRKILSDVSSYDFTSSYPSVMLLEKFPMTKAATIETKVTASQLDKLLANKCCMFDVEIWDVMPKLNHEHPISGSKCYLKEDYVLDNGRVVMAKHLKFTCTEQDFFTYREYYTWKNIKISNFRYYEKQYLPKNFVQAILDLYKMKTRLKDVDGEELNYMISKNMLNAAYGMSVTNPVRDEIKYENNEYFTIKADLDEAIRKYNNNRRRFLFYPWGVWVTAYSRRNLFTGITEVGKDFVYSDTDSIKLLHGDQHKQYFDDYNAKIAKKIVEVADFHRIDACDFSPLNKRGKAKTIGIWEYEGTFDLFKTLGAKRYLTKQGDRYVLTLAGANKKKALEWLVESGNPFENFDDDMTIPSTHSGRLTLSYIDYPTSGLIEDYNGTPYHYEELSSVHMEPSDYTLTMADEFIKYLKGEIDIE